MKINNNIIILFLLFAISISVQTATVRAALVQENTHQREVLDIAARLRCAVCQSQSVAESNSDLANDMKEIIGEQLDQGVAADQIIDYFVVRYGDYILMKPRTDGIGWLLWWLPVAVLVLVVTVVAWQVRMRSAGAVGAKSTELDADQRERLQQLRESQ